MSKVFFPYTDADGDGDFTPITSANPLFMQEVPRVVDNDARYDLFGRLKVSEPQTIWDADFQTNNKRLDRWAEQLTGTGSASLGLTHVQLRTGAAAGSALYESRRKMTYQPGKAMTVVVSCCLVQASNSDSVHRVGIFDGGNGIFFEYNAAATPPLRLVYRGTTASGTVDTPIASSSFSSAVAALNPTRRNIYFFQYKWLGSGNITAGVILNNTPLVAHNFAFANEAGAQVPFWSQASLPVRMSVSSASGVGGSAGANLICSAATSEGGYNPRGLLAAAARSTFCNNIDVGTQTVILAVRCSSTAATVNALNLFTYSLQVSETLIYRIYIAYGVTGGTLLTSGAWNSVPLRVAEYNDYGTGGLKSPTITSPAAPVLLDQFWAISDGTRDVDYLGQATLNRDNFGGYDIFYVTAESTANNNRDATAMVRWQEIS